MGWLFKVDQFVAHYNISDAQWFNIASMYMDGKALSWYQWMHNNGKLMTWASFKTSLLSQFGHSPFRDLRGKLGKHEQVTTVQDYYNSFKELANQILGIPPLFLQICFESGIRRDIQREVHALQPSSLEKAFEFAKLMEDRIADIPYPQSTSPHQPRTTLPLLLPTPNLPPPEPKTPPLMHLSTTQMEERQAKILCSNCDDKFYSGHVCKAQTFMLIAMNNEYDEPDIANTGHSSKPVDYG